jgi:murein DD-endopeptidase MepM/ murein hydrolase activator NlpD
VGAFQHARDIIIPDPRVNKLPVYTPADGQVTKVVQGNTIWGDGHIFKDMVNYITIITSTWEFYQICHIDTNSCTLKVGDFVCMGRQIALTGLNGWITETDSKPNSHLHLLVGAPSDKFAEGFESLRIRWIKTAI